LTERIVLVDRRTEVREPSAGTRFVVLDRVWTPPADERADVGSIRPALAAVLDDIDAIDASLALLDRWALQAGLPEALSADGLTWWFQVRMLVRWDAHELLLWLEVLRRMCDGVPTLELSAAGPPHLAAAASAWAGGAPTTRRLIGRKAGPGHTGRFARRIRRAVTLRPRIARTARLALLAARGLRHGVGLLPGLSSPASSATQRARALRERLAPLRDGRGGVIAVTWPKAYQQVRDADGQEHRTDPQLGPVLEHLEAEGRPVLSVGLGLDHRRDADWALLEADESLVPESLLTGDYLRPADLLLTSGRAAAVIARAATVPARVGDADLGPALAALVEPYGGAWLDWQRLRLRWAERALRALRPGALFTDREASRAAWLAAAERTGIPSVAVQHGMIYAGSPEYFQPSDGRAEPVRPDITCVFGPYERDQLIAAGYDPESVLVTGSPRWDPAKEGEAAAAAGGTSDEAKPLREALGVGTDERLLLVSVAHNPVLGDLHTFTSLARLLGGPLPGIHVVIKLHPQDQAASRHAQLLAGLARAGGYAEPKVTIVRDVDLRDILRAADAHLGQYSTVLSDAVISGTPNMIAIGQAHADSLDYVAAGVAVPVRRIDDVRAFLADPQPPSPELRAAFLRAHYRDGDAVARIAEVLREAADGAPTTPAQA
jgi:hypothetical protein